MTGPKNSAQNPAQKRAGPGRAKMITSSQKQQQTQLHMLRTEDGSWLTSHSEIENLIQQHFQKLLTSSVSSPGASTNSIDLVLRELHLPVITDQESQALLRPITMDEIKESFFSLADNKSPGLDGYNAEFFKHYWPTIGPSITTAIQRFFESGYLLKEWNATLLVLVPKVTPPQEVNHLRPISLCNVLYKCIAKCLVNRMQRLLPALIADYQTAFIPGRHMEDNILLTHELTHTINKQRRNNKFLAALKLDMNKAYDRVKWDFLLRILTAYGFPAHWVQLIRECISTVSYKILINGVATPSFVPSCGL